MSDHKQPGIGAIIAALPIMLTRREMNFLGVEGNPNFAVRPEFGPSVHDDGESIYKRVSWKGKSQNNKRLPDERIKTKAARKARLAMQRRR